MFKMQFNFLLMQIKRFLIGAKRSENIQMKYLKLIVFIWSLLLLTVAASQTAKAISLDSQTPLIDISSNPKGLAIPNTFLGVHLNRWKIPSSEGFRLEYDYYQVPGAIVTNVDGVPTLTTPAGHGFYNYRKGVTVRLIGLGAGGSDFLTSVTGGTLGLPTTPGVAQLATMPPKLGKCTIQYRTYIPTFGYGAVRSHDSGVNWAALNTADGVFNSKLMSSWVARHEGKKIMFTMSGTPEWLAASNIVPITRTVSDNMATINHEALSFPIPVGSKIKIRNCANAALNGERVIKASTTTSTSFSVTTSNESATKDTSTELLLWSNANGYGLMNPPKDFSKVDVFIAWLMKNYGKNIDWIEGPNEANSGHTLDGKVFYSQGQGLWWAGSFDQLGEVMRRINVTAKAIKPSIQIGAPSITGIYSGRPIIISPSDRVNGYQMLSAGDGAGGKLVDWIDFVPFHIYGYGQSATQKRTGADYKTLYENLYFLRMILSQPAVNKPSLPIYMNEGGVGLEGPARVYFDSLPIKQQANEIFKLAAIYAGFGVKGFYPYTNGFLGDYETQPDIAAAYDKINTRIAGKTITPDSWFNKDTGAMFFKTTDGYEEYIP